VPYIGKSEESAKGTAALHSVFSPKFFGMHLLLEGRLLMKMGINRRSICQTAIEMRHIEGFF